MSRTVSTSGGMSLEDKILLVMCVHACLYAVVPLFNNYPRLCQVIVNKR